MFQLLLVILCIQAAAPARTTLKVVFTMRKVGFGDTVGPALLDPLKKVTQDLDVDVDWKIIDTKDSSVKVVSAFFSVIAEYQPHVIIGENMNACCDVMGALASATNTLYISIDCTPIKYVLDRESYPTYSSARMTTSTFGVVVDLVMKNFSWTRVAIVSTANNQYPIQLRLLKLELRRRNTKLFSYVHAASNGTWGDFLLRKNAVKLMMEFLSGRSTFFVLLMDHSEAVLLLRFAKTIGMMNGKHAFIVFALFERQGLNVDDMTPFNGILTIDRDTTTVRSSPDFEPYVANISEGFDDAVWKSHAKGWTKATDFDDPTPKRGSLLLLSVHLRNAVALWGTVLKKARDENPAEPLETIARQGSRLSELSRNIEIDGITRKIVIKNGVAGANWMVSMVQNGTPESILIYKDELNFTDYKHPKQLIWPGGSTTAPEEPRCFVDQCASDKTILLIIICCSLVGAIAAIIIIGFVIAVLWKRVQEKQIIASWRIIWTDVAMIDQNTSANASIDRRSIGSSGISRFHISAALYKGTIIAIKPIPRDSVNIFERSIYNELQQLLHVKHDNINPFIGICVDAPNVCVAMAYAEKGSIQNVLADQQFDIDWEFRMSLALDIVQGMEYLHSTAIETHGHLTSANCVIDERWVCKITDYGLKLFRGIDKLQRPLIDLLWTAPEILRKKPNDAMRVNGTKPADVYSFGIIISELLTRELPYQIGMGSATLEELLAKVKMSLEPPFRPHLPSMEGNIASEWIGLAKNCWQTVPQKRPTFKAVKSILLANHSGKFTNVLERMQMMLEESVERANTDLLVERRKTEAMLESILPRLIVEKIASGTEFEPQLSDSVTLCLCDTIGFYKATYDLPADVVVDVLKSMYQQYDEIVLKYGAFEINTSGSRDSMMLTGGLSINPSVDAEAICTMSLELLSFMTTFTHPRIETKDITMKTTIHTGSAYAALMGKQIPQLNVFGEVIPTTTHLHHFGDDMVIRISSVTRDRLPPISGFKIQPADEITLNDSLIKMYMVTGKDGFTMPLPSSESPAPTVGRKSSSASPSTSRGRKSSSASPERKSSSASPKRKSSSASPKRKSSSASPKRKSSSASPEPTPGRKSSSKSPAVSPERKSSSVRRRSSGARSKKE